MANSEFVDWSDQMVTAASEAVSVACRLLLDPTVTLPKLRAAGLIPSCAPSATPVPEIFISRGEPGELLMIMRMAEVHLNSVGVKMTGNSTLDPGSTFAGRGNSPKEKYFPCTDVEVMVSVSLPVFESWKE